MSTEIRLEIGGMTLTCSKNDVGMDHGVLFQPDDRKRVCWEEIRCARCDEPNNEAPEEMAFIRRLSDIVPRLHLLGFTMTTAAAEYYKVSEEWNELRRCTATSEEGQLPELMDLDDFCSFAALHAINSLDDTVVESIDENAIRNARGRFVDDGLLRRIPYFAPTNERGYSEKSFFGDLLGFLHPYTVLLIIAENSQNRMTNVVWHYGPLVKAGWASEDEFEPGARRANRFLIATKATSDGDILKQAFALLRPQIVDFFRFIDVSERHPFPGAGNLLQLAEGLVRIDIQNQIVFLFDNDAEGFEACHKLQHLSLPPNMRAFALPEMEAFRSFATRGPEGTGKADINRRAAAIECYLDLRLPQYPPACVVWTRYRGELDVYHGTLEHKEVYAKAFLDQTRESLQSGKYDVSRILAVADAIAFECRSIAEYG